MESAWECSDKMAPVIGRCRCRSPVRTESWLHIGMRLASPGFTRWALHRSNRDGVLLFGKNGQQAAPGGRAAVCGAPAGPSPGFGAFSSSPYTVAFVLGLGAQHRGIAELSEDRYV